jgi:hypothetical protein
MTDCDRIRRPVRARPRPARRDAMDVLIRLLLRLILVPLGAFVATAVCVLIVIVGQWNAFVATVSSQPDQQAHFFAVLFLGPVIALAMAGAALMMLMPGAIGVVIAEAFAIRSFLFHVGNGVLSMWIGRQIVAGANDPFFSDPALTIAAGAGAGLAYWLIAGWTAGLRPVFRAPIPVGAPVAPAPASANPALPPPATKPEL